MIRVIKRKTDRGISIIENLIAISLVSIAMAGSTNLFINTFQTNASAKTFTALAADAQGLIEEYRTNYTALLDEFGTNYTSISNGQSASISVNSPAARATLNLQFTALKTRENTIPEAVRIRVTADHRTGPGQSADYSFETIVAQVGS